MSVSKEFGFVWVVLQFIIIFLSAAISGYSAQERFHNLMPVPKKISFGQGRMVIDSNFCVSLSGYEELRLYRAARRLIGRLSQQSEIPLVSGIEKDEPRLFLRFTARVRAKKYNL